MEALLPEISTREGLVLWRVRQRSSRELWCHLTEFCGELILGIHDLQAGDVQLVGYSGTWGPCCSDRKHCELSTWPTDGMRSTSRRPTPCSRASPPTC